MLVRLRMLEVVATETFPPRRVDVFFKALV